MKKNQSIKYLKIFLCLIILSHVLLSNSKDNLIKIHTIKNMEYVSATDFANSQSLETRFYTEKIKMSLQYPNMKMVLSAYCSFIKIDELFYQLTSPVLFDGNDFYIPLTAFLKILSKANLTSVSIDSSEKFLISTSPEYNIHNIKIENKNNGSLVKIKTSTLFDGASVGTSFTSGGWMSMTIPGGIVDSLNIVKSPAIYPISRIRCLQSKESAQISLLLKAKVDDYEILQSDDGSEIVISLRTAQSENAEKIKELRNRWLLDTIVIDAGHGGKDPGAIGSNGIQEKTITLDVARQLGRMIEKNIGAKVIYTRDEDVFVTLKNRTKIANESNGKMFVSIHVNTTPNNRNAKGFETYLLRPGRTDDAIRVAQRENGVIALEESSNEYNELSDENIIIATMAQSTFMKESETLAQLIQEELDKTINAPNRGVKQAGFHVLVGASMPNVLVEIGFLSNKQERKLLGKASYRKKIAKSIYAAIVRFKDKYESSIIDAN
jgi:N-acetylmuramoyl-L-alanine amidase